MQSSLSHLPSTPLNQGEMNNNGSNNNHNSGLPPKTSLVPSSITYTLPSTSSPPPRPAASSSGGGLQGKLLRNTVPRTNSNSSNNSAIMAMSMSSSTSSLLKLQQQQRRDNIALNDHSSHHKRTGELSLASLPRRASMGGVSASFVAEDLANSIHSGRNAVWSQNDIHEKEASANGDRLNRGRPAFSKADSERKLKNTLSMVRDYNDDDDGNIELLRECFSSNKMKNVKTKNRRASLSSAPSSSISSQGLPPVCTFHASFDGSAMSMDSSGSISFAEGATTSLLGRVGRAMSPNVDASTTTDNDHTSVMNMSGGTLPIINTLRASHNYGSDNDKKKKYQSVKTSQMIESIVWFSFHSPRTVLEDLISHELEIWRREQLARSSRGRKGQTINVENESSASSFVEDSEVMGAGVPDNMTSLQKEKCNENTIIKLPKDVQRESALLFVDMSGFTKLSTLLDVESLSKVINSYFDMIVSEVIQYGGDILKFAGDAFFAEWKVIDDEMGPGDGDDVESNALAELNASLASINESAWDIDEVGADVPKLSTCVLLAAKCAASIVRKYSDYNVTSASVNAGEAMLNVHCGIGVGPLVGLHIGDYKEGQEEDAVELRREFLILGDPIEQVSKAADVATDGEVYASPEAMTSLAFVCDLTYEQRTTNEPFCIASRNQLFIKLSDDVTANEDDSFPSALQPYESLRMHCNALNQTALARLHLQMALYVHPVIRGDELALSAAIQAGKISQPTETIESRHRAEAELRSVFTMFIKAIMSPRITGMREVDKELYTKLGDIMHIVSRELDRYGGHLRQFIVDDKGVVLIATFGLRGSTFPNMVANNGLPAAFAIHGALKNEIKVENRIGATFGKVYCGIVGALRRHEFAVMGAPVNLAARLMSSKVNKSILVDEAVREQAGSRFAFSKLPPVEAKGYSKPVPILEPLHVVTSLKRKKSPYQFVGRKAERSTVISVASSILEEPELNHSSMVFLSAESGMGKSALALAVIEELKKKCVDENYIMVAARSTSNETEQRIPLSSFRKVFMTLIRERLEHDGTLTNHDDESKTSANGLCLVSLQSLSRRGQFLDGFQSPGARNLQLADVVEKGASPSSSRLQRLHASANLDSPQRDEKDSNLEHLSASLRSISMELSSTPLTPRIQHSGGKHYLPTSLSQSTHGAKQNLGFDMKFTSPKPTQGEPLSTSLHRLPLASEHGGNPSRTPYSRSSSRSPLKTLSTRSVRLKRPGSQRADHGMGRTDDSSTASVDASAQRPDVSAPYFEKLCWVCEQLKFPFEYADIVGSQFLGFESASPVTHVDGHIPTMDELVEFLALAFICLADFAKLTAIFLDDFQWVDAFSWKIFRTLCKRGRKLLLICATRSHDKQARRRMSTAASSEDNFQSHTTEISLGPLDYSEIKEFMSSVLGYNKSAINDAICSDIFQRTGGVPVYVVQVLEHIKRNKTLELVDGTLKWTAEGLREKRSTETTSSGAVMEETFLSRFDSLDVTVRKVLQTCAVLGLSFALTDVIQVHPEMEELDIELALDSAVDEMIIVEQVDDNDDALSILSDSSHSEESDENTHLQTVDRSRSSDGMKTLDDRYFRFCHAMWRKNVLQTMLKERKIELHRLIAESMERDQVEIFQQSDISRLLTLFDHWKSCGDFSKSAPLALAVGARLEEWDLSAQSLELYEDALDLSVESVQRLPEEGDADEDWVQVKARPLVLDLVLRLHICIALCHKRMGDDYQSILFLEDAHEIIKSSSKIPRSSRSLIMPIISTLCMMKLEEPATNTKARIEQEKLIQTFVASAIENGSDIHLARALSVKCSFLARQSNLLSAVDVARELESIYNVEKNMLGMINEYGREFALEIISESVQWLYLLEKQDDAERTADRIVEKYLPLLDPGNTDGMMYILMPILHVLKLLGRAKDSDWLLKKYVINPYHDFSGHAEVWPPLFNPLAYLLELVAMEESDECDQELLDELEKWVMNEDNASYPEQLDRQANTLLGEICWRLANFKEDEDPSKDELLAKAREFLTPVAKYNQNEIFLKHTSEALLDAM